jgi:DNA-binding NarL/FixJ family response regulator
MAAVRAILVDDHTMFREGLVSVLSSRGGGIEVVGHSSMGEEALALIREHRPDVVITQKNVDLNMAKEVLRSFVRPAPGVAALRLVAAKVAIADYVAGECLRVRD